MTVKWVIKCSLNLYKDLMSFHYIDDIAHSAVFVRWSYTGCLTTYNKWLTKSDDCCGCVWEKQLHWNKRHKSIGLLRTRRKMIMHSWIVNAYCILGRAMWIFVSLFVISIMIMVNIFYMQMLNELLNNGGKME